MPDLPLPSPEDYSHPTNWWLGHPSGQQPAVEDQAEDVGTEGTLPDPETAPSEDTAPSEEVEPVRQLNVEGTAPEVLPHGEITPYPPSAPTITGVNVTSDVNLK